jgi:hypothetical protein
MSVLQTAPLNWSEVVPTEQWDVFRPVLEAVNNGGPDYAVGGGLAFSAYTGRIRNTKDIDLFVCPAQHHDLIAILTRLGFEDYYDRLGYDRKWIYRGYKDGGIMDVIWQMANYRSEVEPGWVTRGPVITLRDVRVRLLPPEELLWTKLYVMQRERCDWPDLLNLLHAVGPALDFAHVLACLGDDAAVLGGLLNVFGWLCPEQARKLPARLWGRLGLRRPAEGPACEQARRRVHLLDTRDWFGSEVERATCKLGP